MMQQHLPRVIKGRMPQLLKEVKLLLQFSLQLQRTGALWAQNYRAIHPL